MSGDCDSTHSGLRRADRRRAPAGPPPGPCRVPAPGAGAGTLARKRLTGNAAPSHDTLRGTYVAGGLRIAEPAADLAVAAALLSAREDAALPPDTVVFGEISLSGALRPASQTENRLKEAQKLGFTRAIAATGGKQVGIGGISLSTMRDLTGFVGEVFGAG